MDVFNGDRSIIHQNANCQRQAPKSHEVDGFSQQAQGSDGRQNGKRNGNGDDHRAAPASEKKKNHDSGEARGDERLSHHAGNGPCHKNGLISDGADLKVGWECRLYKRQKLFDAGDDVERRGRADLLDGHQRGPSAVDADNIGWRRKPVAHEGDVTDIYRRSANRFDRKVVQSLDCGRASVHVHVVFKVPDLRRTGRKNEILRADGVYHVEGRQPVCLQCIGVQIHLDLPLFTAVWIRNGSAADRNKLGPDEIQSKVIQLLLRKGGAGESELKNGNAGGAVSDDQRRRGSQRQLLELGLGLTGDLRNRCTDIRARVKKHFDDSHAVQRLRFYVLNVIYDRGQVAFLKNDDSTRHVLRRQPREIPNDAHYGDVDVRKNVCGSAKS